MLFEAPPRGCGGEVEFIPHWHAFCAAHGFDPMQDVEAAVAFADREGLVEHRHHDQGDVYLLRADRLLHRVTPLGCANARRSAINMAFEGQEAVYYGETASRLYDMEGR
jgi:hypothetical protein